MCVDPLEKAFAYIGEAFTIINRNPLPTHFTQFCHGLGKKKSSSTHKDRK